jgi:hypothetical protein
MKFKTWRSVSRQEFARSLWSVQDEKETDRSTLRRYSIGGDDDVIE